MNRKMYKNRGVDLDVTHFTEPFQILGIVRDRSRLEVWIDEAKELKMQMYIEGLATIVYDAIEVVENFSQFELSVHEYVRTAQLIGPPEKQKLRYVGEKKDYQANRQQFGQMFQRHIEKLLVPKVKEFSHDEIMENNLMDALKIRAFVDKHWARYGKRKTTMQAPKSKIKISNKHIEL